MRLKHNERIEMSHEGKQVNSVLDLRPRRSRPNLLLAWVLTALLAASALGQTSATARARRLEGRRIPATTPHGHIRAVLAPTDFPISLTAYDRTSKVSGVNGTLLVISRNGFRSSRAEPLYTRDLEGAQISSIVSWQNADRTHFGFFVLTTPAEGNLYGVMFFLYHDGKISVPIDDVATGYPVIPTIRQTDVSGQIQISYNLGDSTATNDKVKTVVIYTWSDWSKRFLKATHTVAAASVHRARPKHRAKVEKTQAAQDDSGM